MQMMRWGLPTPPKFLKSSVDRGVTDIRNVHSSHWRPWIEPEFRCLVPATSFCEPTDEPLPETGKKDRVWFALDESRPLFAFAGIWCTWHGTRGAKVSLITGEHRLYGFLVTGVVQPMHSKAMPVVPRAEPEFNDWLEGDLMGAIDMQRPLPHDVLRIVARGEKEDR